MLIASCFVIWSTNLAKSYDTKNVASPLLRVVHQNVTA